MYSPPRPPADDKTGKPASVRERLESSGILEQLAAAGVDVVEADVAGRLIAVLRAGWWHEPAVVAHLFEELLPQSAEVSAAIMEDLAAAMEGLARGYPDPTQEDDVLEIKCRVCLRPGWTKGEDLCRHCVRRRNASTRRRGKRRGPRPGRRRR